MKIVVLGAGAIGAYVGACLQRGGSEVTLVARNAHMQAMLQHGVSVISPLGDFVSRPAVTNDFEAVADADVVFIGLKAYSVPEIAPHLGEVLKPGAAVIWAQNGIPWWYFQSQPGEHANRVLESVDPNGIISQSIRREHNIGCVVYCSSEIVEPGVIRHIEGTRFTLGEPDNSRSERCSAISIAFAAGGLKAPVDTHLRDQIWLKLVGNVAFNPISALTRAKLGDLGTRREMIELIRGVFDECAEIATRLGIKFSISLDRRLEAGFAVGGHKTSMLQDLEAGRPLELNCMTGAVLELANLVGVQVPRIATIHTCALLLDLVSRSG